tara:strand:+ start:665 stop:1747 length:1083 start_codon:yes stop_codon:yes gene_type:complete
MREQLRVGIAGSGSVALGTAALLSKFGHDTMIWSRSGTGTKNLESSILAEGALEAKFETRIAKSAEDLVNSNEVMILALPAFAHKAVMNDLAPYIQDFHQVIISSHASLGAIYLTQLLRDRGVSIPVTAWGTTVITGRRNKEHTVYVNTIRDSIDLCTVPEESSSRALVLCEKLFGKRFKSRKGLLAISLSNLNPQNHLGIALGNITRMERGEDWSQGQNVTPSIGRFLEKLDLERLSIASALGLKVKTIFEHFHTSFHVPVASVSEMNQQMHSNGNGGKGPNSIDSRYVIEDAPYGLQLIVILGQLVNRPAILHESGVKIFSAMYDRDFSTENELLNALSLTSYDLESLQQAARTGLLH